MLRLLKMSFFLLDIRSLTCWAFYLYSHDYLQRRRATSSSLHCGGGPGGRKMLLVVKTPWWTSQSQWEVRRGNRVSQGSDKERPWKEVGRGGDKRKEGAWDDVRGGRWSFRGEG